MKRFPWISLVLLLIGYISFGWYLSGLKSSQPAWLLTACYQVFGAPKLTQSHVIRSYSAGTEKPGELHSNSVSREELHSQSQPTIPPLHTTEKTQRVEAQPQKSIVVEEPANGIPNEANPSSELVGKAKDHNTHSQVWGEAAIAHQPHHICSQAIKHNVAIALLAVGWILFSSMMFMSPLSSFSRFINRWFQSDTVAFMMVFLIAGIIAVLLFWLHVALQILTILAAESLARIDIQIKGLTGVQAFWILTLTSLTGLAVGWLANGVL